MKLITFILPIVFSVLLTACGGAAVKPETPKQPTPPLAGKPGGYYLDDGPGDNPPVNLDSIPDAIPRAETPLERANRPYKALGKSYTPMVKYAPYKQRGIASWYGRRYHGQKTSSGEVYDMYGMTGAHTTLPIPSYVKVTNPANGRSVIVRINDRGPFHSDRLIDLSYAAAHRLRLVENGSGLVEVEAIDASNFKAPEKTVEVAPAPAVAAPDPAAETAPLKDPVEVPGVEIPPAPAEPPVPVQPASPPAKQAAIAAIPSVKGLYVQLGVFRQKENADRLTEQAKQKGLGQNIAVESMYNNGLYRVLIGPYSSRAEAGQAIVSIKQKLGVSGVIVQQK